MGHFIFYINLLNKIVLSLHFFYLILLFFLVFPWQEVNPKTVSKDVEKTLQSLLCPNPKRHYVKALNCIIVICGLKCFHPVA